MNQLMLNRNVCLDSLVVSYVDYKSGFRLAQLYLSSEKLMREKLEFFHIIVVV